MLDSPETNSFITFSCFVMFRCRPPPLPPPPDSTPILFFFFLLLFVVILSFDLLLLLLFRYLSVTNISDLFVAPSLSSFQMKLLYFSLSYILFQLYFLPMEPFIFHLKVKKIEEKKKKIPNKGLLVGLYFRPPSIISFFVFHPTLLVLFGGRASDT